jgi:hypothetical protein
MEVHRSAHQALQKALLLRRPTKVKILESRTIRQNWQIRMAGGKLPATSAEAGERGSMRARFNPWCGQEDSNFHGLSATTTSTLRVYQFRHGRTPGKWALTRPFGRWRG